MAKDKKNPLYVVTNNGKDVESASSFFDLLYKKLGLEPLYNLLDYLLHFIMERVSNYATFVVVKEMLDTFISELEQVTKKVFPSFYFYKA